MMFAVIINVYKLYHLSQSPLPRITNAFAILQCRDGLSGPLLAQENGSCERKERSDLDKDFSAVIFSILMLRGRHSSPSVMCTALRKESMLLVQGVRQY